MPTTFRNLPAAALALAVLAAPALAGSLGASSAAGGSSASAGSSASSDSSATSSNSSSKRTTAAGPYRITEVAALADRPGELRLQLQAMVEGSDDAAVPTLALVLPVALVARHGLAVGGVVTATPQPYGTAFAQGTAGAVFHLRLDEGWQRELDARPVQAAAAARS